MAFLVFEGIDGAGKSTLIKGLLAELEKNSISYELTREPGGTPLGEELREILLRKGGDEPSPRAELLLYETIRAHHVETKIKPCLENNQWVISDRYGASSLAFQAGGRQLDREPIDWLNNYATGGLDPHLYILLDLDPMESQKRLQKRASEGAEMDRFEVEKQDFHVRVRDFYLKIAKENSKGWLVLDASKSPEDLQSELFASLKERGLL